MNNSQFKQWCKLYACRSEQLTTSPLLQPLVMGILNITPDSFSDGGMYLQPELAMKRALEMIAQGADIIDIGGESSRPGAMPVSCTEELSRVIPVIQALSSATDTCISIDTTKVAVMEAAAAAGAGLINDITALSDEAALSLVAQLDIPVCLMHMQGKPSTMQDAPDYIDDIITVINAFFAERITTCLNAGIARENLILDPGFGFGKMPQHNLRIVNHLKKFNAHNLPLMLGVSRKSTLGLVLGRPISERLLGGVTTAVVAALRGVSIIRTHDVEATCQALKILQAILAS